MAHLTCTEHKRRSLVFTGSKGYARVTHRSDGTECIGTNPNRWEDVHIFGRQMSAEEVLSNGERRTLSDESHRVGITCQYPTVTPR